MSERCQDQIRRGGLGLINTVQNPSRIANFNILCASVLENGEGGDGARAVRRGGSDTRQFHACTCRNIGQLHWLRIRFSHLNHGKWKRNFVFRRHHNWFGAFNWWVVTDMQTWDLRTFVWLKLRKLGFTKLHLDAGKFWMQTLNELVL